MADVISIRLENENNTSIKVVNIIGKTIKMLSFLRSAYSFVKDSYKKDPDKYPDYDLSHPGVYLLFSEDNKSIYIGESDDVMDRLNRHYYTDDKTEYWVKTMVFVADGNYPLNISQIKYIESKLLENARNISQVKIIEIDLKNKNSSLSPNISTNDKVVADNFLADIISITKILGLDYFDVSKTLITPEEIANKDIFSFSGKKHDAKLIIDGDSFVVLADSKFAKEETKSLRQGYIDRRNLLLENGQLIDEGKYYVAVKNIPFETASGAACVVCGGSANGKIKWKNKNGETIKDLE